HRRIQIPGATQAVFAIDENGNHLTAVPLPNHGVERGLQSACQAGLVAWIGTDRETMENINDGKSLLRRVVGGREVSYEVTSGRVTKEIVGECGAGDRTVFESTSLGKHRVYQYDHTGKTTNYRSHNPMTVHNSHTKNGLRSSCY